MMQQFYNLIQVNQKNISNKAKYIKKVYVRKTARIHPAPVIVLGHQKTGTSVIASLLGETTNKSGTIDMFIITRNAIILT